MTATKGDSWCSAENKQLLAGLKKGMPWKGIAAGLPGRSEAACRAHAHCLGVAGVRVQHRDRAGALGRSKRLGRPPNKVPSARLSFRLHQDTRDAFKRLAIDLESKPGLLLREALERLHKKDTSKLSARGRGKRLNKHAARVPVCWGVPERLLARAKKSSGLGSCALAEAAVLGMLEAHGYTFNRETP